jgi:hypothetical protein
MMIDTDNGSQADEDTQRKDRDEQELTNATL